VNAEQLLPNYPSNLRATLRYSAENVGQRKEQNDNCFEINKNPASASWRNRGVFISIDTINFIVYNNRAL
jgi:hypothetical protein